MCIDLCECDYFDISKIMSNAVDNEQHLSSGTVNSSPLYASLRCDGIRKRCETGCYRILLNWQRTMNAQSDDNGFRWAYLLLIDSATVLLHVIATIFASPIKSFGIISMVCTIQRSHLVDISSHRRRRCWRRRTHCVDMVIFQRSLKLFGPSSSLKLQPHFIMEPNQ